MKVSENQPSWPIVEIKDLEGETTGLVITLDFLGVDWPDRLDSSEGRRGNCGELSANSALHPGISCLSPILGGISSFWYFQIKIMKALEDDADYKLKTLKENDLDNKDIEEIKVGFLKLKLIKLIKFQ